MLDKTRQTPVEEKEGLLFPKEKWDELIVWQPVSNIPVEEIYENLPEAKQFHESYVRTWLKDNIHNKGR